jgi:hypothetical protein
MNLEINGQRDHAIGHAGWKCGDKKPERTWRLQNFSITCKPGAHLPKCNEAKDYAISRSSARTNFTLLLLL